jgi:hypothetical protein
MLAGMGTGMGAGMLTAPFSESAAGQVALMAALTGGGGLGSYFTRRSLDRFGVKDRD